MARFAVILFAMLMICTSATMPTNNLAKGLVCYLPLDEGAGLLAFDLTKRTNGAGIPAISTLTWTQSPRLGKALLWAAANTNKVTIGKPSCLNLTSSTMTIAAWVYITDLSVGVNSGYRYICSDYNSAASNAQFALQVTNGQRLTFFWANGGTQAPNPLTGQGATTISTNTLYHCVGVRSGATGAWTTDVYLNGYRDGGTTTATNPCAQSAAGKVQVGQAGDYTGALGMVGSIKGLRIYDRAMTATEVRQLYLDDLKKIRKVK